MEQRLHSLVGLLEEKQVASTHSDIRYGIQQMLEVAETHADRFILPETMEVRWAARGLVAQLGYAVAPIREANNGDMSNLLSLSFPQLDKRVECLPFDILPRGVDFSDLDWLGEYDQSIKTQAASRRKTQER